MHKTNTVDYAVVYEGEIWLELDDAKNCSSEGANDVRRAKMATRPRVGENKGTTPVTMLFLSEWSERVTPGRSQKMIWVGNFKISAVGPRTNFFQVPRWEVHTWLPSETDLISPFVDWLMSLRRSIRFAFPERRSSLNSRFGEAVK